MHLHLSVFILAVCSSAVWLSASMGVSADAVDQPILESYIQQQSEDLVMSATPKHVHGGGGNAASSGSNTNKAHHEDGNHGHHPLEQGDNVAEINHTTQHYATSSSSSSSSASSASHDNSAGGSGTNIGDHSVMMKKNEDEATEVSWADRQTKYLYDTYGDTLLTVTGLTLYFVLYMALASVYFVMEYYRMFPQWRIQPEVWAKKEDYYHVLRHLLRMFFLGLVPAAFVGAPALAHIGITANRPLPDGLTFFLQILSFWVIEDIFQYFLHRMLHTGWMYKRIHKQHHDYQAPFALAATYAHPVEVAILGFCSFVGPVMLRPHLFVMVVWMIVQQTDACVRHSGYDFPFDPLNWLPLYGGPKFHDAHHEVFSNNYASRFVMLDMIFGTYKHPGEMIAKHRAKMARLAARTAADNNNQNNTNANGVVDVKQE